MASSGLHVAFTRVEKQREPRRCRSWWVGPAAFYLGRSKLVSGGLYLGMECPRGLDSFPLKPGTRWKDALQVSIDNHARSILDDIRAIS